MLDFKDNTYSKEVEKEKYRLKEAAEEIQKEWNKKIEKQGNEKNEENEENEEAYTKKLNQAYSALAKKHEEFMKNSEQE